MGSNGGHFPCIPILSRADSTFLMPISIILGTIILYPFNILKKTFILMDILLLLINKRIK